MRILLIGGPKFLGRHITTAAADAGHEITHFNRGNYAGDGLPPVEIIRGDRYRDLNKLADRKWDVVIDNCGYLFANVRASAEALKDSVERYIFISSISAYADTSVPGFDETAQLKTLDEEQQKRADAIDVSGEITAFKLEDLYGALKAACERAVESAMPGRTIIIRPGLIVGEHDGTDRFTYWVMRITEGGEVLAPGRPERAVQFIDVRDLAEWTIRMAEACESGIYNANGKPFEMTMDSMLNEIREATGSDASFRWASEEFLAAENVTPWSEMPMYLPESAESLRGFLSASIDRALEKGLSFRPLAETTADVLKWRRTVPESLKAGISREREAELLSKLKR